MGHLSSADMNIPIHAWSWSSDPPPFNSKAIQVMDSYVKLPRDLWESHVARIVSRELAWDVAPWPFIGSYGFLDFSIADLDEYEEIVARLREGQTILDIGAGLGQDLRALASDGVDTNTMTVIEPESRLWDLGFDMFRDKHAFRGCDHLAVDIFHPQLLRGLKGSFNVIWNCNFIHLFSSVQRQSQLADIMLGFLNKEEGNLIVGMSLGGTGEPGLLEDRWYRHTERSIQALWQKAAAGVEIKVVTSAKLVNAAEGGTLRASEPYKKLYWCVRILEGEETTP